MRFLFCPLASHGYVYPAIGMALELRRRNHEVAFVTSPLFSETLAQVGIKRIPRGPKDGNSFDFRVWGHLLEVVRQVKHLEYACEYFAPDVLIGTQLTLGPLVASRRHQLPVAVLDFATYLWPTWGPEHVPQSKHEKHCVQLHESMIGQYIEVCDIFGLQLGPDIRSNYRQTPFLGDICLLRSVPELEGNVDLLPERLHLVGDCLWEPPQAADVELTEWLEESVSLAQPIIFVQHGKGGGIPDFWRNLVQALKNQPIRVIAAVRAIEIDVDSLPKNFFVRKHIPHGLVLRYAQAVATLGTTSTMLGALTSGLPMLLFPMGSEQPYVAKRCQRAGVAVCLPPYDVYTGTIMPENITPKKLGWAVQEVIENPELRRNAQRIQRAFQNAGGQVHAANLLELLAIKRRPILREDIM